jgi:two-component system OmpR family response regulator
MEAKKKVLIIDDEEDLCHLMELYLTQFNYDVYLAYTLGTGILLLSEVCPDILFIDNNLPDGLGWEKAEYLREKFPDLKINLISAYKYVPPELKKNSGIKILEKPISLSSLREYL